MSIVVPVVNTIFADRIQLFDNSFRSFSLSFFLIFFLSLINLFYPTLISIL